MSDTINKKSKPNALVCPKFYEGTRAQAIKDGLIIDVSKLGFDVGFLWPLAITKAVWDDIVAWTDEDSEKQVPQDEKTRLSKLVNTCADYVRVRSPKGPQMTFRLNRVPRDGKSKQKHAQVLELWAHREDGSRSVLTIRIVDE